MIIQILQVQTAPFGNFQKHIASLLHANESITM